MKKMREEIEKAVMCAINESMAGEISYIDNVNSTVNAIFSKIGCIFSEEKLQEIIWNEIQVFIQNQPKIRQGSEDEIEELMSGVEEYAAAAILSALKHLLSEDGK